MEKKSGDEKKENTIGLRGWGRERLLGLRIMYARNVEKKIPQISLNFKFSIFENKEI